MGFDREVTSFVVAMSRSGVSFRRTLTLGRQRFSLHPGALARSLRRFGDRVTLEQAHALIREGSGYVEPLLRRLGAEEIVSIDASSYEHCTEVHDLNQPIPSALERRFTAVVDAGVLEHVFDFPQAMENCMRMVEPGGHLLVIAPGNNEMGHGFYQFSPELYFRLLVPTHGFRVEALVATEPGLRTRWYRVRDPQTLGRRVTLRSRGPVQLYVRAVRDGSVSRLVPPQQSDYEAAWHTADEVEGKGAMTSPSGPTRRLARLRGRAVRAIPRSVRGSAVGAARRLWHPRDRVAFQRIDPRDLAHPT